MICIPVMAKLNFQQPFSPVFSVTWWSFKNSSNMLILRSRNISYCYP